VVVAFGLCKLEERGTGRCKPSLNGGFDMTSCGRVQSRGLFLSGLRRCGQTYEALDWNVWILRLHFSVDTLSCFLAKSLKE
jgi:hypothetical protein